MAGIITKANPRDVVKAFQKAAKELGCGQSEQRFQEALFALGRYKPTKVPANPSKVRLECRPGSNADRALCIPITRGHSLMSALGLKQT